jgi:hypothetical protein
MTIMKPTPFLGILAVGCGLALALPQTATAQVSESDFSDLKKMVQELNQKMQRLEQLHQQDVARHKQDQQQIQDLKHQVDQTQTIATNAQAKAEAAAAIQPPSPGPAATHNFMMVGDAEVQFGKVDGSHAALALADFAPIFLYRAGDNALFEAGFDTSVSNNRPGGSGASTSFDLSFAQLDYVLNDYMTLVGGYMLLPLGTYTERGAGWLNKIPDDPLPRGVLPSNGAGAQLRGSVPIGGSGQMVTYSVYGANGPGSMDGSASAGQLDLDSNVGINSDGSFGNLHGSPSGGGRIGWFFPWKPNYDLELGLSGQSGTWDDADQHLWSAAVLDAALHVSPYVEIKGEYINTWAETSDAGTVHPRGWWIQGGYKLNGLNLDWPLINNVELVGRYDTAKDGLGTSTDRYTAGFVYYFSNTLLLEGDYEVVHSNDPTQDHNAYVFQLSYGF